MLSFECLIIKIQINNSTVTQFKNPKKQLQMRTNFKGFSRLLDKHITIFIVTQLSL